MKEKVTYESSNDKEVVKKEERNLGLLNVFNLGFGGAIGSGIFVLLGLAIGATGKSIIISVLLGIVVMTLAYFFNILLASMFMLPGGDYAQKAIAMNPFFTGLSAYITVISGLAVSMYSLAAVDYASIVFPVLGEYSKLASVLIVVILFAFSYKGSKFASNINSVMTFVLLLSILIFIVKGLPKVQSGYFSDPNFYLNGKSGLIQAMVLMGWACQGTTMGPVAVQAVTKDSKKTVPKAIGLVALAIAVVYGLMSIVASGVLPISEVGGQNLSIVANEIFSRPVFVIFIIGGAVFAILTSMMSLITCQRYPMLNIARDGWLPSVFTKTNDEEYPYVIYMLYFVISLLPIFFNVDLGAIVSMVMIPAMILNTYMNFACIRIIDENPEQWEKSSMRTNTGFMKFLCILASLCAAFVGFQLFRNLKANEMIVMLVILLVISLLSIFNIKTGRVSKEQLDLRKKKILEEAYASEEYL